MDLDTIRSITHTVGQYLLLTLLASVSLSYILEMDPAVPLLSLAGATASVFLFLTLDDVLTDSDNKQPHDNSTEWSWLGATRWEQAALLGLIIVGVSLRAYALGEQSLWFDEAITVNAAVSFLESGRPVFESGVVYWRAFTHTAVVSASLFAFGISEWAARLPSVVFGAGSILATYWLGREAGGPRVGLLAAGLTTFVTWEIAWSRQARMYQLFQLLYLSAIVVLLRIDRQSSIEIRYLGLLVAVIGVAAATHPVGYILLPVAVVFLSTTAVLTERATRRSAGLIIGATVVLTIVFELVGPGITGALNTIAATDVSYWDAYISWGTSEIHAFFYFAVVGTSLTAYIGARRAAFVYVLAVLPPAIILSVSTQLFATRYLYFALPFVFVWASVSIVVVATYLSRLTTPVPIRRLSTQQLGTLLSVVLLCTLTIGGGFTVSPQQEYQLGVNAPQPEFKSAYTYVNEHRESDDVIIAGWTAPGVYYAGGVDYWLEHDLTGSDGSYTVNGRERYSGAIPIRSADELNATLNRSTQIWIVLDRIAYLRQPPQIKQILSTEFTVAHQASGTTVYRKGNVSISQN